MGWTITYDLVDGQGRPTSHAVQLVNSIVTVAAAQAASDLFVADWPTLSGLGLVSASLSLPLTLTPTAAQTQSNIDEGARVKLLMVDGGKFNYRVPGPLKDGSGDFVYITGGVVDVADTGIVDWFANFITGASARITKYGQRIIATDGILSGYLEKR